MLLLSLQDKSASCRFLHVKFNPMKAVKVEYTVKPEYIEQNKANIRKVMKRLKEDPIDGMLYSTYTLEDERTFIHINVGGRCKGKTLGRVLLSSKEKQPKNGTLASLPLGALDCKEWKVTVRFAHCAICKAFGERHLAG